MKTRLTAILLLVVIVVCIGASSASATTTTRQISKHVTATITVVDGGLATTAKASTGWQTHNAKCVVKYYDLPGVRAFQYTVFKHWDFNTKLNKVRNAVVAKVRNVVVATDSWTNAALKAKGDWSEEVSPIDFYYSRPGNDTMDAHFSGRHARFHSIFGIKGFSIPIGAWYCDVRFWVFARNKPNSNQNWSCVVNQHWRYLN